MIGIILTISITVLAVVNHLYTTSKHKKEVDSLIKISLQLQKNNAIKSEKIHSLLKENEVLSLLACSKECTESESSKDVAEVVTEHVKKPRNRKR